VDERPVDKQSKGNCESLADAGLSGRAIVTDDQSDLQYIPESMADEVTQQMLARARKQTVAALARKLKVSREKVRSSQKRTDLYISTFRGCVEGVGGKLSMIVEYPDRALVILSGLGLGDSAKSPQKKAKNHAKSKAKSARTA
jgi:hypothetical protein